MDITKEVIEQRKKSLEAEYQQATATAQAIFGAMQDCEYWLKLLEQKENGEANNLPANPE